MLRLALALALGAPRAVLDAAAMRGIQDDLAVPFGELNPESASTLLHALEVREPDCVGKCPAAKAQCDADEECRARLARAEQELRPGKEDVPDGTDVRWDGLYGLWNRYHDEENWKTATAGEQALFTCAQRECMQPRLAFANRGADAVYWKRPLKEEHRANTVRAAALACPHTAQVLDANATLYNGDGTVFGRGGILMPRYFEPRHCDPGTCDDCAPGCREKLDAQVGAALDCLHAHGFVHHDVQAQNILALNDAPKGQCPDWVLADLDQAQPGDEQERRAEAERFRRDRCARPAGPGATKASAEELEAQLRTASLLEHRATVQALAQRVVDASGRAR